MVSSPASKWKSCGAAVNIIKRNGDMKKISDNKINERVDQINDQAIDKLLVYR